MNIPYDYTDAGMKLAEGQVLSIMRKGQTFGLLDASVRCTATAGSCS